MKSNCPQVLTAWERVYRLLRRRAFRRLTTIAGAASTKLQQSRRRSSAHFPMAKSSEADLLVGARDGIAVGIAVRQQCCAGCHAASTPVMSPGAR